MKRNCYFAVIALNSFLLVVGISLVVAAIFAYNNHWPLLTILVHLLAILFPTICGSCQAYGADDLFGDSDAHNHALVHVPWVFFGLLVIVGYAVPVELYRAHQLDQIAVWLTVAGGSVILCAVLIYVRVIYFERNSDTVL